MIDVPDTTSLRQSMCPIAVIHRSDRMHLLPCFFPELMLVLGIISHGLFFSSFNLTLIFQRCLFGASEQMIVWRGRSRGHLSSPRILCRGWSIYQNGGTRWHAPWAGTTSSRTAFVHQLFKKVAALVSTSVAFDGPSYATHVNIPTGKIWLTQFVPGNRLTKWTPDGAVGIC